MEFQETTANLARTANQEEMETLLATRRKLTRVSNVQQGLKDLQAKTDPQDQRDHPEKQVKMAILLRTENQARLERQETLDLMAHLARMVGQETTALHSPKSIIIQASLDLLAHPDLQGRLDLKVKRLMTLLVRKDRLGRPEDLEILDRPGKMADLELLEDLVDLERMLDTVPPRTAAVSSGYEEGAPAPAPAPASGGYGSGGGGGDGAHPAPAATVPVSVPAPSNGGGGYGSGGGGGGSGGGGGGETYPAPAAAAPVSVPAPSNGGGGYGSGGGGGGSGGGEGGGGTYPAPAAAAPVSAPAPSSGGGGYGSGGGGGGASPAPAAAAPVSAPAPASGGGGYNAGGGGGEGKKGYRTRRMRVLKTQRKHRQKKL
ncbi:hypothetical protein L596_026217 [Steinernema carpocapsae]|uniref:Uncharacterized protein n=1 Tax=Steinernema carpocapsae TaxID=34508 RepID=A0A4U5M0P5_STECR|nr:hypothetical protein L596_026217 [Steinernema carpocapsae]